MGKGSILKNLRNELQSNDLIRQQQKSKRKHEAAKRKDRDQEALASIREIFNPFNAKFNNKKSASGEKVPAGAPAAARSAAEDQRRKTYEAEKRLRNKVGGIVDRRFGERDKTISEEEKMVERYAREKLNKLRKASHKSFNIEDNSDEENDVLLTHGGRALSFDDDFAEDDLGVESDEESLPQKKKARIEGDGGDSESNSWDQNENAEGPTRVKTKAEVMQEIIAKSKMHKLERQRQKQADDELIDNLNADFDELVSNLASSENSQKQIKEIDEYDRQLQELAFDKRADPSDRTKTEEEIAKQREMEKMNAEKAKMVRMEGDELDIPAETALDDAHLFGLRDMSEGSDDNQEFDDQHEEDAEPDKPSGVSVPETVDSLKKSLENLENVPEKIRYYIKLATPGKGSGSKRAIQNLSAAVLHLSLLNPSYYDDLISILHDVSPKHEVGMRLANETRDLINSIKRKKSWGIRECLLFSFVGSIFSTSDQWHVVATSASLVMTQRLSQSVEADLKIISINLFLCDLLLVYQRVSKRYIPEVLAYLLRVLAMVSPKTNSAIAERYVRLSPYKILADNRSLPAISASVVGSCKIGEASSLENLVVILARIVGRAASMWRSLEGFPEAFIPLKECLSNIPHRENAVLKDTVDKLDKLMFFSRSERKFLELQQFKPVGIVTQAPLFDENYNPEIKGASLDPEQRELQKLKALHKKEKKSSLREIRRDAEFESRQTLEEKRREMAEYHEKLRRLEGQINGEGGAERNAYEREKQKRKRR